MCARRLANHIVYEISVRKKGLELLAPGRNVANGLGIGITACIQYRNVRSKMFVIKNWPRSL